MKKTESVPAPGQAPTPQAWIAVANGDLAILKEELSGETDVNAKEPMGGGTLLMTACFVGQTETARYLIERGADIELANNDGSTPLMTAVFMCQTETVQLLLENGAQINQKNNQGQTPLDAVVSPWTPELEGVYKYVGQILQIQIDLERIKSTRGSVADILLSNGAKRSNDF